MSRIASTFEKLRQQGKKALIPFITSGDPEPQDTVPLMHALVSSGADIIELGVPFSDPMADGPTIQRSSERALRHGITLNQVLHFVSEFRKTDNATPIVLMGYANPVEAMGYARFAEAAKVAGVDGVLVVDLPPEESSELISELKSRAIDAIFLISPTTTDARMEKVARYASGYIYYVSLKGVTGAQNLDLSEVAGRIPMIRKHIDLPVGVGFGIRDAATAQAVAKVADAIVVGSKLVQEIESAGQANFLSQATSLMRSFRAAMDQR